MASAAHTPVLYKKERQYYIAARETISHRAPHEKHTNVCTHTEQVDFFFTSVNSVCVLKEERCCICTCVYLCVSYTYKYKHKYRIYGRDSWKFRHRLFFSPCHIRAAISEHLALPHTLNATAAALSANGDHDDRQLTILNSRNERNKTPWNCTKAHSQSWNKRCMRASGKCCWWVSIAHRSSSCFARNMCIYAC